MKKNEFILAGWLIDGTGDSIRQDMLLHIKDGYIESVRKAEQTDLKEIELLDLSHCTILPGLIDCHLHLFMSGTDDQKIRQHQLDAEFVDIKDVISAHLKQLLSYGIVAIRDGGDKKGHALRYKTECLDKKSPICVKVAGRAWHQVGRYGRLIGRTPLNGETLSEGIERDFNEIGKGTLHSGGNIDHVKIVNSGLNSLIRFGKETEPQFDLAEMQAAVKTANRLGLPVMVHANSHIPVQISVEAGCHSVEHGFFMGKDNLKQMAEKNVTWVPTAITMKGYAEKLKPNSVEAEVSQKNLDHQLEQIAYARGIGVSVALGTDAGSLGVHHGAAVIEEMKLLMAAGFPIQEAIRCATWNGAKLLNLTDTGLLAQGMPATFVAVKGTPSELPESLKQIECFYVKGIPVNSISPQTK